MNPRSSESARMLDALIADSPPGETRIVKRVKPREFRYRGKRNFERTFETFEQEENER